MDNNVKKSFMQNSLVMMISLLFVKLSGLLFKLPVVKLIGGTGYGYFSSAYNIYLPVYVLALSGFPAAVSRLVAAENTKGNYKNVRLLKSVSISFFTIIGFIGAAFLTFGSGLLSDLVNNPEAQLAVIVLSPTVLFCCIMSAYRGYYNGLSNLYPTAVSQAIEALGKLLIGFGCCYSIMKMGTCEFNTYGTVFGNYFSTIESATEYLYPFAAAGAIFGVSVGSILACIYIIIKSKSIGDGITTDNLNDVKQSVFTKRTALKKILRVGIPISLGAAVMQLCTFIDNFTILNSLGAIMESSENVIREMYGYDANILSHSIPNMLWGCYGIALIFYNLVPLAVQSFSQSAIPDVTDAYVTGDREQMLLKTKITLRMSLLFALPVGFGIIAVSKPLIGLFDADSVNETQRIIQFLCIAAILSALCQPVNSILQSVGKYDSPVILMLCAAVIKLISNVCLMMIPGLNILGAAIGSIIAYGALLFSLIIVLRKTLNMKIGIVKMLIPPLLSAIVCSASAWIVVEVLQSVFGKIISLIIAVLVAVFIYFVLIFITNAITHDEIEMIVKNKKIIKVLEKLRILR